MTWKKATHSHTHPNMTWGKMPRTAWRGPAAGCPGARQTGSAPPAPPWAGRRGTWSRSWWWAWPPLSRPRHRPLRLHVFCMRRPRVSIHRSNPPSQPPQRAHPPAVTGPAPAAPPFHHRHRLRGSAPPPPPPTARPHSMMTVLLLLLLPPPPLLPWRRRRRRRHWASRRKGCRTARRGSMPPPGRRSCREPVRGVD